MEKKAYPCQVLGICISIVVIYDPKNTVVRSACVIFWKCYGFKKKAHFEYKDFSRENNIDMDMRFFLDVTVCRTTMLISLKMQICKFGNIDISHW